MFLSFLKIRLQSFLLQNCFAKKGKNLKGKKNYSDDVKKGDAAPLVTFLMNLVTFLLLATECWQSTYELKNGRKDDHTMKGRENVE